MGVDRYDAVDAARALSKQAAEDFPRRMTRLKLALVVGAALGLGFIMLYGSLTRKPVLEADLAEVSGTIQRYEWGTEETSSLHIYINERPKVFNVPGDLGDTCREVHDTLASGSPVKIRAPRSELESGEKFAGVYGLESGGRVFVTYAAARGVDEDQAKWERRLALALPVIALILLGAYVVNPRLVGIRGPRRRPAAPTAAQ